MRPAWYAGGVRTPRDPGRSRWYERFLFSFMGPPQLGDLWAPATYEADPAAERCDRCGRPWEAHTTVRTASRGYLTCPQDGG
jgi:hypothetical protein